MTKDPLTLTHSVPQGKVSPTRLATMPENHHRARLPKPPPTKIHSAFHILALALPEFRLCFRQPFLKIGNSGRVHRVSAQEFGEWRRTRPVFLVVSGESLPKR